MSESFKDFFESNSQKTLIHGVLKDTIDSMEGSYSDEMPFPREYVEKLTMGYDDLDHITEKVYEALNTLNEFKNDLVAANDPEVKAVAEENGVSERSVIESITYFQLIVENVWLGELVSKLMKENEEK